MSQTNEPTLHKISIKRKPGPVGTIPTGMNTLVEIDGQPLRGCTYLKFEIKPNKIGKLTLELLADFNVDDLDAEVLDKSGPGGSK